MRSVMDGAHRSTGTQPPMLWLAVMRLYGCKACTPAIKDGFYYDLI